MQNKLLEFWNGFVERCGFVLADGELVELSNCHEDPRNGFRIDAAEILKYGGRVIATWHTHPLYGPNLSVEDYKCFLDWPEWQHIIIHKDTLRIYYVEQNRVLLHDDSDFPRLPEGVVS